MSRRLLFAQATTLIPSSMGPWFVTNFFGNEHGIQFQSSPKRGRGQSSNMSSVLRRGCSSFSPLKVEEGSATTNLTSTMPMLSGFSPLKVEEGFATGAESILPLVQDMGFSPLKVEEGFATLSTALTCINTIVCFSPLKVEEGAATAVLGQLGHPVRVSVLSKARKGLGPTPKICHADQGVARPFAFCGVCERYLSGVYIRMSFEIEVFLQ